MNAFLLKPSNFSSYLIKKGENFKLLLINLTLTLHFFFALPDYQYERLIVSYCQSERIHITNLRETLFWIVNSKERLFLIDNLEITQESI